MKTILRTAVLITSFAPLANGVEVQTQSFTFDGVRRTYKLGIPDAPPSTPDLVMLFHGATSNKDLVLRRTGIFDLADEFGIVVAAPDAANDWFGGPQDSPEFLDALLDAIRTHTEFSDDGVGAMGMSQGGIFSLVLAATRPNVIKAAANVSGGYIEVPLGPRPFPVIDIQGTIDVVAPYPGGPGVTGFAPRPAIEAIEIAATHNQCELTPVETALPDIEPGDRSTATLLSYPNCAFYLGTDGESRTADVIHYRVDGGGHSWPGDTNDVLGFPTNLDFDATRVILEQFADHTLAVAVAVQAGDADQDLDFDQLDLIQVQIAAKYLSRQAATWGEGDWDGAPGGSPGNPPNGNGLFDQLDIIAALSAGTYLTGPYAALAPGGSENDEQTSLVYDRNTGELRVNAPASTELTSIFVTSEGNLFIGDKPAVLDGPFDSFAPDNVFKSTIGGSFGDNSFGNVLPAGLSEADVVSDLSASGSLVGGGGLGEVDLVYVPEPRSVLLLGLGLSFGLRFVRRKNRQGIPSFSLTMISVP